ncbi:MAG: ABC transporter substrate-binding protein, partial [Candidatus Binatia bacterium]
TAIGLLMEPLRLTLSCNEYDRTRFLVDGTVKAEGIDLNVISLPSEERHRRFSRDLEFDVCELQMGVFLGWMARGAPFTAIPVFPHRKFCHGNVLVHAASGIEKPADLAGKIIGMRAHFNPVSLWMRGVLQEEYGVPSRSLKIRTNQIEQVPGWQPPDWMEIERIPNGQKVEELLLRGEIDACMLPEINFKLARNTTGVGRLWPNFRDVEKKYYLRTKIFPIRHVVVVKNAILELHPWVAQSLVEAFAKAKEIGIKHVSDTRRSFLAWYGAELEEERDLFGDDAWPYNIKDNRVVLETMTRYAEWAGVTDRKLDIKDLFAESASPGESV